MAVEITVVDNENINITIESGGASSFNPAANINFTATNVQRNGVEIAVVTDILPFDLAADYDTTGEWSYSIDGQVQQLMTDDPTYQAMTYVFATTDDGLIAPDIVYDIRQTDLPNANGYESSRNKITGDLSTKITSKTAEISTSYNASLQDSIAKVYANGKGLLVTDTGTGVNVAITADSIPTINTAVIATMGTTIAGSLDDTYESPVSDLTSFKTFTWLTAYNYIKSKLSAAGFIYLTTDTFANINTNFPPATYSGCIALATDIDSNDSTFRAEFYSNGSIWRPVSGSIVLSGRKYPACVAPTGSVTAAGSGVTLGNALPVIFSNGIWLYINATSGLTAGWYFAIMSSTTIGVLYGTAQSLINDNPSTTPTVIPGNSAFTGDVNEISAFKRTIPGGLLRTGSRVTLDQLIGRNSGGTTTVQVNMKLGSTTIFSGTGTTANQTAKQIGGFVCTGSAQQIKGTTGLISYQSSGGALNLSTENTAVDIDITSTVYHPTTATDYAILVNATLEIIP